MQWFRTCSYLYLEHDELVLTVSGRDELIAIYPEVEAQMLKQGELFTAQVL